MDTAQEALLSAKVESSSALNGIGVVKLMGRSSGFIAMQASLASGTPLAMWIAAPTNRFCSSAVAVSMAEQAVLLCKHNNGECNPVLHQSSDTKVEGVGLVVLSGFQALGHNVSL